MKIGELARRTGFSVSRIRFYETRGLLPQAPRHDNGYRSYGEEAVAILDFANRAQSLGFSLTEIADAMPDPGLAMPSPPSIAAALRRKDADLDRLIAAAQARKTMIAALLDELRCVG